MDHQQLLDQINNRLDRLEDHLCRRFDSIEDKVDGHADRLSKVETHQGWVIKIGTALIVGAWTAIVTIYKTL